MNNSCRINLYDFIHIFYSRWFSFIFMHWSQIKEILPNYIHFFVYSIVNILPGKIIFITSQNVLQLVKPVVCCFVSWRLRNPHWGNADEAEGIFGFCSPASRPTLKKALCSTCPMVVRRINKVIPFNSAVCSLATTTY